jgi:hypothetical protein
MPYASAGVTGLWFGAPGAAPRRDSERQGRAEGARPLSVGPAVPVSSRSCAPNGRGDSWDSSRRRSFHVTVADRRYAAGIDSA